MHDISFFLLKNILPVGASAIAFFGVGLLFAKAIWGRYNQRLSNAVEENLNLAGQWSALGASQQDLFKKLRVRWQSDRDTYEAVLAEKEARIAQLGERLKGAGAEVPAFAAIPGEELISRTRVSELEAALEAEREAAAKLRDELDRMAELPMLPFAVKSAADKALPTGDEALQTRIRELEQDLIDTHDELHNLRADYEKQVKLVESLESKLISAPAPAVVSAEEAAMPGANAQFQALLAQRSRELRHRQGSQGRDAKAEIERLLGEIESARDTLEQEREEGLRVKADLEAQRDELLQLKTTLETERDEFLQLEANLETEKDEHLQLKTTLETERGEHLQLKATLETERDEHLQLKTAFAAEQEAHLETSEALESEKMGHVETKSELEAVRSGFEGARAEISRVESELDRVESELEQRDEALRQLRDEAEKAGLAMDGLRADFEEAKAEIARTEAELARTKDELGQRDDELLRAWDDVETAKQATGVVESDLVGARAEITRVESELAQVKTELAKREEDLARLRDEALEAQAEKELLSADLARLEEEGGSLRRRRSALQAELNDACHELYDVRRALNLRLDEIGGLTVEMDAYAALRENHVALSSDLDSSREEAAATAAQLADSLAAREELDGQLSRLRAEHEAELARAEELAKHLNETRRDLSEVRIALAVKTEEYQKSVGQMEELEAIISDRSAEVNDLSAELRQQREQMRLLKNTLAETQGELEALSEESRTLNAGVKAGTAFIEEQRSRIASLEAALSERYSELNKVRTEAEERARETQHHESRVAHLEAELERRDEEFEDSSRRIASAEEALETAHAQIASFTTRLQEAEVSLVGLREELDRVSREKDETLQALDRATLRVSDLEEAARKREAHLEQIERELAESREIPPALESQIAKLQTELESAREERRLSALAVGELEEAIRSSDEHTLGLSARLDEKEAEAASLVAELAALQGVFETKNRDETEARAAIAALEKELESGLAALRTQLESAEEKNAREIASREDEIERLKEKLAQESQRVGEQTALTEANDSEIAALRDLLSARIEEIQELQVRIGEVMMQRASRECEISTLKEKLRALDGDNELRLADYAKIDAEPVDDGTPLEAITLADPPLSPQPAVEPPLAVEAQKTDEPDPVALCDGADDESIVFFNESAAALTRAETEKIDRAARSIRRLGGKIEVTLVGYAGTEGTPDFQESLSARRADSVRERLVERGVSLAAVKIRAAGPDRRFSDWKARRVEMVLSPVAVAETVN